MNNSETCQELYELIRLVEYKKMQKIPREILKHISNNRNEYYLTSIDIFDPFNPDNVSREAFKIFFELDYNYMMTEEEKRIVDSEEESAM